MDNKILVNLKNKYLKDNKINNFLNSLENECLICYCELDETSVILINNFCGCYRNCFLCQKCFTKWFLNNCRCFICHKKYRNIEEDIFQINVPLLKHEIKSNIEKLDIEYITRLINEDENIRATNILPNRRDDTLSRNVVINMNNRNLNINQSQVFPTASQINRPQQQTLTNFRNNIITCTAQICFLLMIATAMYLFVFAIKQLG
tara:strand:- start:891 stop:1505 length:615 start_codon:yes stop_codon:yes gene_type:complete